MDNARLERARCVLAVVCASTTLVAACKRQAEWGKYERREYVPSISQLRDTSDDEFYFAFPAGVERRRFALLALESLDIGAGVTIRPTDPSFYTSVSSVLPPGYGAFVGSLGELSVGDGAVVGSIYAWGNRSAIGQVTAAGFIKYADGQFKSGAHATLGILNNGTSAVAQYVFVPPLAPVADAAPSRIVSGAESGPLEAAPGVYNELVASEGATLRLFSGAYRVRKLSVGEGAVVEISNAEGPVEIWVERELAMKGTIEEQVVVPNILLSYGGRDAMVLPRPFRGTLVAPRAEVTLLATDPPHVGAFYARKITVAPKTSIRHVTFYREAQLPMSLPEVCQKCAASARIDASVCEVDFQQREPPNYLAAELSYTACAQAAQVRFQHCLLDEHWRPGSCSAVSPSETIAEAFSGAARGPHKGSGRVLLQGLE